MNQIPDPRLDSNLPTPTVYLIDDEPGLLESLVSLLRLEYPRVLGFTSGRAFLEAYDPTAPGCIVADLQMPELTGIELQAELRQSGHRTPIVFLSGQADVGTAVQAMRQGAEHFLQKPISVDQLTRIVTRCIHQDEERFRANVHRRTLHERLAQLTPREVEVMNELLEGKSMKQIAKEWKVAIQTVAKHRSRVLDKMEVEGEVELIRELLHLRLDRPVSLGVPIPLSRSHFARKRNVSGLFPAPTGR